MGILVPDTLISFCLEIRNKPFVAECNRPAGFQQISRNSTSESISAFRLYHFDRLSIFIEQSLTL